MSITRQFFESELILAQFAHALAGIDADIAGSRLQIATEDFHESGLAAAVGADQAVAVSVAEFDRYIFEQGLCPELNGNIGCGDQSDVPEKGFEKPSILHVFSMSTDTAVNCAALIVNICIVKMGSWHPARTKIGPSAVKWPERHVNAIRSVITDVWANIRASASVSSPLSVSGWLPVHTQRDGVIIGRGTDNGMLPA